MLSVKFAILSAVAAGLLLCLLEHSDKDKKSPDSSTKDGHRQNDSSGNVPGLLCCDLGALRREGQWNGAVRMKIMYMVRT